MARRILYGLEANDGALLEEETWEEIMRLQRWYNAEFIWTTGKIALKRYVIFPRSDDFRGLDVPFAEVLARREATLRRQGMTETGVVRQLEQDGLVSVRWGGYLAGSLASGFTRVANNEWNAYLVCDFLLKVSRISPNFSVRVIDEGTFVRHRPVVMRRGDVVAEIGSMDEAEAVLPAAFARRIFSVVDPRRYERHRAFRNQIGRFNALTREERDRLIENWNWLGFEFDPRTWSETGWNLNEKVGSVRIAVRTS